MNYERKISALNDIYNVIRTLKETISKLDNFCHGTNSNLYEYLKYNEIIIKNAEKSYKIIADLIKN